MLGAIILAISGGLSSFRPVFLSYFTRLSDVLSP
jgi:hypothetical protein